MILGHDFHSEDGYRASVVRTREAESQPTWRNLVSVLTRVGIPVERCFFTNVYMGLRAGSGTTGPFPGAADADFVRHCERFLGDQLRTLRPSLIITLGINVPPVIGRVIPGLSRWAEGRGLRHLDEVGPVQRDVRIDAEPPFTSTAVALTHPSLRHASVRHRSFAGERGDAAELAMLRDALASLARHQQ